MLVMRDAGDRESDAAVGQVGHGIDAVLVEPAPGDGSADVGFVLVVGEDDLHLETGGLLLQVFRRKPSRGDRPSAHLVGKGTTHVGQDADLELVARDLVPGGKAGENGGGERQGCQADHRRSL